jgi:prepilin peptidase CpaA
LPAIVALIAGYTDWRSRRIPNWLTVPALAVGIALGAALGGWAGAKSSLLGAGLGLLVLLPFVLIRSLGAGDWKLVGALGSYLGPNRLITVLFAALIVAGVMALILVIWKGRFRQTVRNMGRLLAAFGSLHLPGEDLTLDDPKAAKVPFGVAVAIAVVLYTVGEFWKIG